MGSCPELVAKKKMCIVCANMLVSASAFFDFFVYNHKKTNSSIVIGLKES